MKKYFLLINLLLLMVFSCELEDSQCSIQFENGYFERLNEISLGDVDFGYLSVGEVTSQKEFNNGIYELNILTASNLNLSAVLTLEAEKKIKIVINSDGHIILNDK